MGNGYDQSKYMVVKRDDLVGLREQFRLNPNYLQAWDCLEERALDPDSYFLLRDRDFASRVGLGAYKEGVLLELDTVDATEAQRRHLLGLADGVSELMELWRQVPHGVPD